MDFNLNDNDKYVFDEEGYFIPPPNSEFSNYKTVFCNNFQKSNFCTYGYKCLFAHHIDQLRKPSDPIHRKVLAIFNNVGENDYKKPVKFTNYRSYYDNDNLGSSGYNKFERNLKFSNYEGKD